MLPIFNKLKLKTLLIIYKSYKETEQIYKVRKLPNTVNEINEFFLILLNENL